MRPANSFLAGQIVMKYKFLQIRGKQTTFGRLTHGADKARVNYLTVVDAPKMMAVKNH